MEPSEDPEEEPSPPSPVEDDTGVSKTASEPKIAKVIEYDSSLVKSIHTPSNDQDLRYSSVVPILKTLVAILTVLRLKLTGAVTKSFYSLNT